MFNIVAACLPAVLISMNCEYFEIISHEIEYCNELTMSFVDLVLLWSLCQFEVGTSAFMSGIASIVALIQLAVYNGMGRDDEGDMIGEVPAHYLEFAFEIISSLIAFWFVMDNKVRSAFYDSYCTQLIMHLDFWPLHNQILLCLVAFLFDDSKFVCGKEIGEILYGTHRDCNICVASSMEYIYLKNKSLSGYGSFQRSSSMV